MLKQVGRFIFGKSIESSRLQDEKLNVFWGMPILSSDAISSVTYASEEILWVLIPVIGLLSYSWMPLVSGAIILLLLILIFSYRHVVDAYPNGGGAYVVAKENLSPLVGLVAGSSLFVDYILTVAVSVAAGTAAVTSAVPGLYDHRVGISLLFIIILAVANIRGIRESSRIFSIPTYAFILAIVVLVIAGIIQNITGTSHNLATVQTPSVTLGTQTVTLFLLIRAFASGCSAVTGVEAISDAVPNFKEPAAKNAKLVYIFLAIAIMINFGGVTYLGTIYHAVPNPQMTLIAQITLNVFGQGTMFYIIQATTAMILALAANTAFAGFPTLLSIIAQDGYAPRQMAMRGHRLNFNNGIFMLTLAAIILIIIFKADTHLLLALYAIGVFSSFTLSQTGMVVHWYREHATGWKYKAFVNGLGALTTLTTVIIIGITKFAEGAWIVFLLIPLMILLMLKIKNHYSSVAHQLDVPNDILGKIELDPAYSHHVIVPIDSLNAMTIKALRYARSMTNNVEAFHVEVYDGEADKLRKKWEMLNTSIPLVIKFSPYREVIRLLTEYIDSEEHASKPGDVITVLLPQFVVSKHWQLVLHNNTSLFIANSMLDRHNVVVSILPFYLEDYHLYKHNWITKPGKEPR